MAAEEPPSPVDHSLFLVKPFILPVALEGSFMELGFVNKYLTFPHRHQHATATNQSTARSRWKLPFAPVGARRFRICRAKVALSHQGDDLLFMLLAERFVIWFDTFTSAGLCLFLSVGSKASSGAVGFARRGFGGAGRSSGPPYAIRHWAPLPLSFSPPGLVYSCSTI